MDGGVILSRRESLPQSQKAVGFGTDRPARHLSVASKDRRRSNKLPALVEASPRNHYNPNLPCPVLPIPILDEYHRE